MNAPDPHKPPPLPPWATPWHATIIDPPEHSDTPRPPPVPMVILIAASCLALGLILGRMF